MFRLPQIRDIIDRYNQGLTGGSDISVINDVLQQSTAHWKGIVNDFFNDTRNLYSAAVEGCLERVLRTWKGVALEQRLKELTDSFTAKALKDLKQQMERLLAIEYNRHITTNLKLLDDNQPEFKRELVEHYQDRLKKQITAQMGLEEVPPEIAERVRQVENKCDQELDVMAVRYSDFLFYCTSNKLTPNR